MRAIKDMTLQIKKDTLRFDFPDPDVENPERRNVKDDINEAHIPK